MVMIGGETGGGLRGESQTYNCFCERCRCSSLTLELQISRLVLIETPTIYRSKGTHAGLDSAVLEMIDHREYRGEWCCHINTVSYGPYCALIYIPEIILCYV